MSGDSKNRFGFPVHGALVVENHGLQGFPVLLIQIKFRRFSLKGSKNEALALRRGVCLILNQKIHKSITEVADTIEEEDLKNFLLFTFHRKCSLRQ